jgi:hypothetical protein
MVEYGFSVGSQFLPWGTTLADIAMRCPIREQTATAITIEASAAFDLPLVALVVRAPASDRPVLQAWYELRALADLRDDEPFLAPLIALFGEPHANQIHSLQGIPQPAAAVHRSISWRFGDIMVGVSLYGAVRTSAAGRSYAVLFANWENEIAAAAPYLAEFDQADLLLAQLVAHAMIDTLPLEMAQQPFMLPGQARYDPALHKAQRCLRKRTLRSTPASITSRLQADAVAIWQNRASAAWGISTVWETVAFRSGELVRASLVDLRPAKGAGGTFFTIGELALRSTPSSRGLHQLAAVLEQRRLADVDRYEEDDV